MSHHRRTIVVALSLMAVPLLYAVLTFAARPAPDRPWLEPPAPSTSCVLPKERMRYEHMRYLKGLRDQVIREGRREQVMGAQAQGIGSCRGCHPHRELFCDRCHERSSVRLDCFGCHAY
jgi:hypothetical protein